MKHGAGLKLKVIVTIMVLAAILCWKAGMDGIAQRLFQIDAEDLDRWLKVTCFAALALMWVPHPPRSTRLKVKR